MSTTRPGGHSTETSWPVFRSIGPRLVEELVQPALHVEAAPLAARLVGGHLLEAVHEIGGAGEIAEEQLRAFAHALDEALENASAPAGRAPPPRRTARASSPSSVAVVSATPSGVLISCATPATSWPSEASFSAWIRSVCVFRSSASAGSARSLALRSALLAMADLGDEDVRRARHVAELVATVVARRSGRRSDRRRAPSCAAAGARSGRVIERATAKPMTEPSSRPIAAPKIRMLRTSSPILLGVARQRVVEIARAVDHAAAVASMSREDLVLRRSPSMVVPSPFRHWSSASIISDWISGEIGSEATVVATLRLSSRMLPGGRVATVPARRPCASTSFSVSMAMFCVACSVSADCTE